MLNSLLNLKRNPHQRYGDETETKPARPKSVPPHLLKPTQESVAVIATHDDLLILRDYSVVSAIGFGSMSDAMLDKNETAAKLDAYRRLLKYVRFDFQLLIGTRPQNLNTYLSKMERKLNRFASMQTCIEKIAAELPAYFAKGTASFDQTFGFAPADLFGTPGEAHAAALTLNQPEFMKAAQFKSEEGRQKMITTIVTQCDETVVRLRHLRETLVQRADHVEMTVQASRTLVRTFALVGPVFPYCFRRLPR